MMIALSVSGVVCALFCVFLMGGWMIAGVLSCAAGLGLLVFRLIAKKKPLTKKLTAIVSGTLSGVMLLTLLLTGTSNYAARTAESEFATVDRLLLAGSTEESANALTLLNEMQSKYPNSTEIYIRQAQANSQLFNDGEAKSALSRCAADMDIRYYLMKADQEMGAGNEAQARDTYMTAAALFPQNHQIQFNTGFLCYVRGDMTKAEFYLLRACTLEPRDPYALFFLGSLKAIQGDYEAAQSYLESAHSGADDALREDIKNLLASLTQKGE